MCSHTQSYLQPRTHPSPGTLSRFSLQPGGAGGPLRLLLSLPQRWGQRAVDGDLAYQRVSLNLGLKSKRAIQRSRSLSCFLYFIAPKRTPVTPKKKKNDSLFTGGCSRTPSQEVDGEKSRKESKTTLTALQGHSIIPSLNHLKTTFNFLVHTNHTLKNIARIVQAVLCDGCPTSPNGSVLHNQRALSEPVN